MQNGSHTIQSKVSFSMKSDEITFQVNSQKITFDTGYGSSGLKSTIELREDNIVALEKSAN